MINLDDGRFSYSSKDTIYMNVLMYITVEPLYNEVLALTNSFFFNFSNRRVLRAIMALGGSTIGFSNLAFPLVFFLLIPLSRPFFTSESRSRALFFFYEFLAFIIQCLSWLAFLQQGALMFKVLDLAISDRNSIYLFIYLFIFLSAWVQKRRFSSIWVLAIWKQPVVGRWMFRFLSFNFVSVSSVQIRPR